MAHTLRLKHPHVSHDHRIVSNVAVFGSMLGALMIMLLILWSVFSARPAAAPSMDPALTHPNRANRAEPALSAPTDPVLTTPVAPGD